MYGLNIKCKYTEEHKNNTVLQRRIQMHYIVRLWAEEGNGLNSDMTVVLFVVFLGEIIQYF
jgi:hypothetical protein